MTGNDDDDDDDDKIGVKVTALTEPDISGADVISWSVLLLDLECLALVMSGDKDCECCVVTSVENCSSDWVETSV